MPTFVRARHLATMTAAGVIEDGCLALDAGRVVAVGRTRDVRPPRVDIDIAGLVTPGLVNAHTHLELSDRTPGDAPPAGGFGGWLTDMVRRSRTEADELARLVTDAVAIGVAQCLAFGVTTVGDVARQCRVARPLLAASPLRVVSFGEVQAFGARRHLLAERLAAATDAACATERLHVAVTPHAPYSVEPDAYRACLAAADRLGLPLTTHLAEAADEGDFLADHAGSLRTLWDTIGGLTHDAPKFAGGPIRFAAAVGLLDRPTLLAHVNYCDDAELDLLAGGGAGRASVVWCPRTHHYFGHPPHRWRAMKARRIRVCVGTDSCASSPDLNVVDDLRLVRRQNSDVPAAALWPMVTSDAADALRWGDGVGRLTVGGHADFVSWPTAGDDPLAEVLDSHEMRPSGVGIAGQKLPLSVLRGRAGGGRERMARRSPTEPSP